MNDPFYASRQPLEKDTNRIVEFCSNGPFFAKRQSLQKVRKIICKGLQQKSLAMFVRRIPEKRLKKRIMFHSVLLALCKDC